MIEHPVIVERNKLPPPKPLPLMLTKKVRMINNIENRKERSNVVRIEPKEKKRNELRFKLAFFLNPK